MKKMWVVALVAAVGLALLGTSVHAGWGMGCAYCPGYAYGPTAGKQVDINAFRAFQKETLPFRDEMMAKRLELRNEYTKEKPNQDRIATLQKEMIDIRARIQTAAEKQGLPAAGFGPGTGGRGYGARMVGCGGRGWGGQGFGGSN